MPASGLLMESRFLVASLPYQWIFTLFTLSQPPIITLASAYARHQYRWELGLCRLFFVLYTLLLLSLNVWLTHENNITVETFVRTLVLDDITCFLGIGNNISGVVTQIVIQFQALCCGSRLQHIYQAMARLEHNIRVHCRSLQPNCRLPWRLAGRTGVLLLINSIFITFCYYNLVRNYMPPVLRMLCSVFAFMLQLKCVEYCLVVQLLNELIYLLYKHLVYLRHDLACCDRRALRLALCGELRENQLLLARAWLLLCTLEGYFTPTMLILFLYNGFGVTQEVHWAQISFESDELKSRIYRVLIVLIYIINMLVACWLSQKGIDLYKRFGYVLHTIKLRDNDRELNDRLQEYSLQLMHQPMIFTCGGFFDINLKNFGGVILTVTTYIVILIQFKLQSKNNQQRS